MQRCRVACNRPSQYFARDPYCLADPACVSPTYRAEAQNYDWSGARAWRLGSGRPLPRASRMLSPINGLAFIVLMAGIGQLLTLVRGPALRAASGRVVETIAVLEVARWLSVPLSLPAPLGEHGLVVGCCAAAAVTCLVVLRIGRVRLSA